ncbi:hypothetical protein C100_22325 [Sphingobium sp. C100]|jgi:hypothetical protein|uniref:PilZ domain-containing protein n=1 Tax=Sphingobium sp. C100 TaxID=1207055 RepID=UPI0003D5E555|nr:PilZ domain-containing protein [Sphingobium sp. C100]ETI58959.1 hypothetical protein C100_22325 [Sphingobium sp. C100]
MEQTLCRARAERRREQRFVAEVNAMLSWNGTSQPVEIRNISIYGALVAGAWLPLVGERVTLIADHLEVCGTVIWNGPDRCGLLLSHAVDPRAIIGEAQVREGDGAPITLRQITPGHYA